MSPQRQLFIRRLALGLSGVLLAGALAAGAALTVLYQQLPELGMLIDYQPRQPLRVYTRDGVEIAAFGAERRHYLPIGHTPRLIQDAVLAIEDAGFREHAGVSLRGTVRAFFANLWRARSQGGSTITQQVARTFYLSKKKSYMRKLREALLAIKIERHLSKDEILELYLNQIYMGQKTYGFEAASRAYFGKPLTQLSVAESAMLAGVPQNPRYANPAVDFARARKRQLMVLDRMLATQVITPRQHALARAEPVRVQTEDEPAVHAEYVAEMVRQTVYAEYGEAAYSRGLKVITSLVSGEQDAAWRALRRGVLDHERRQPWRGPEDEEELPAGLAGDDPAVAQLLAEHPDDDDLRVAIVTEASPRGVVATLATGEVVRASGAGLRLVQTALTPRAAPGLRLRRGAVIRMAKEGGRWVVAQWPEVQGALVALEPATGRVRALVGGFDFARQPYNHATQAWRQPGSSFKPFVYSAALEHGVMPHTLVNDAPLPPDDDGLQPEWTPKNADGQYDGPITLREALARSKNLATIRLVQLLGPDTARAWAARFGFEPARHPADLTLALGSGATTPLQLASAYGVLANGGHAVQPLLIERITDAQGKLLFEGKPPAEPARVIPERNAWLTGTLLQEATRSGTAARAQAQLARPDLYGKTGTTDDAVDAWFAGYQPTLVAVVWMGHDTPRSLGAGESGGGLALPVWISFMREALKDVPVQAPPAPAGLVQVEGEWVYDEWAAGRQQGDVGFEAPGSPPGTLPADSPRPAPGFIDLEPPEVKANRVGP